MTDRQIIFSAPMVRALLDGSKTQTRRYQFDDKGRLTTWGKLAQEWERGARDQRVWVREAHAVFVAHGQGRKDGERWGPWGGLPTAINPDRDRIAYYREGFDRSFSGRWKPSIHMPRWASRLTLDVTGVKVERLKEISEEDARKEGCDAQMCSPRDWFCMLWKTLHGEGAWDANPWVVAVTFTAHHRNIDR